MIEKLRVVPISEIVVSTEPDEVLIVYGLGSCVAICLYDPRVKVGGMLHALLPSMSSRGQMRGKPAKFVEQGVPLLIDTLRSHGARPIRMRAYVCGGAQMLSDIGQNDLLNIGRLNTLAAEQALNNAKIHIQARAIGGRRGRTVRLYLGNGQVTVKTLDEDTFVLV